MPAAHIPWQRLVGGNRAVGEFPNKGVDADLPPVRLILVPMIVVRIFAQQAVVRANIALESWIVCPGGMHHDALRDNSPSRFIAGVVCQNEFMQVHLLVLLFAAVMKLLQDRLEFFGNRQPDMRGVFQNGNALVAQVKEEPRRSGSQKSRKIGFMRQFHSRVNCNDRQGAGRRKIS